MNYLSIQCIRADYLFKLNKSRVWNTVNIISQSINLQIPIMIKRYLITLDRGSSLYQLFQKLTKFAMNSKMSVV